MLVQPAKFFGSSVKWRNSATRKIAPCVNAAGSWKRRIGGTKKLPGDSEEPFAPFGHPNVVAPLVQKRRPAILKTGKFGTTYAMRQELSGCSLHARFGRHLALVQFLQALPPPRELDCPERRLRRLRDDVGHRVVDAHQCVECGPELGWPVEPDEIAVTQPASDR